MSFITKFLDVTRNILRPFNQAQGKIDTYRFEDSYGMRYQVSEAFVFSFYYLLFFVFLTVAPASRRCTNDNLTP